MNGILTQDEFNKLNQINQKLIKKVENFGLQTQKIYLQDLVQSIYLFDDFNQEDLNLITRNRFVFQK